MPVATGGWGDRAVHKIAAVEVWLEARAVDQLEVLVEGWAMVTVAIVVVAAIAVTI